MQSFCPSGDETKAIVEKIRARSGKGEVTSGRALASLASANPRHPSSFSTSENWSEECEEKQNVGVRGASPSRLPQHVIRGKHFPKPRYRHLTKSLIAINNSLKNLWTKSHVFGQHQKAKS